MTSNLNKYEIIWNSLKAQIPQSNQSFFAPTRTILEWSMVSIEIIENPTVASGCLFLLSGISLSEFLQAYLQCDGPQHGRTQPWTLEGTIKNSRNLQRHHGAHDAYLILFSHIRLQRSCIHRIRLFCFKGRVVDLRRRSRETRPVQPEQSQL